MTAPLPHPTSPTANAGVFVLTPQSALVPMQSAQFASEDDFQDLLARFPALLAGDQIDAGAPRRFLLVSREQGVAAEEGGSSRWSLDHLFLDQDGVPTLVEVKRSSDTRLRREVVGQMLDYAANGVLYWPVAEIRARFELRCADEGLDSGEILTELTGSAEVEGYWARVDANLQAGRVRLLFVADRIPPELRRVVEFLNGQMQPAEVLAVELRQYQGEGGLRALVPIVLGQSQGALQRKGRGGGAGASRAKRAWDEAALLAELAGQVSAPALEVARRLLDWAARRGAGLAFSDHPDSGWAGAEFRDGGADPYQPIRVWSDGVVSVHFQYMLGRPVFGDEGRRRELLARLNAIEGVSLPESAVTKRPSIQLEVLAQGDNAARFLAAMDWFADELRAMDGGQ